MLPGRLSAPRFVSLTTALHVRNLLLLSLLISFTAAALQQQPYYRAGKYTDDLSNAVESPEGRWHSADSLHTPDGRPGHRDTGLNDAQPHRDHLRTSLPMQRALATVSPAERHSPGGLPPALRPASTAGLATRQPARSLQDWQVEDIMLLATVDGKLHARDRRTGAGRWTLEVDTEMVETVRHRDHRLPRVDDASEPEDPLFIVEPSQDGSIFIFAPGMGLQRLGYTVKQLAELAPYASEGYPSVAYTAEKKNTLYTVDAATGNILKTFSSTGSIVNDDQLCRRTSPLDALEEDECEPIGTITLGRTEYIIGIQDRNTGEPINTLRYFEWGPNNRDDDLRSKYTNTMDNKYVYTKYDGTVLGLDVASDPDYYPNRGGKPIYRHKFTSPVVRIFDIMRPQDDVSGEAALVILPQPIAPSQNELADLEEDPFENVFVNCTDAGNWYALSETSYPTVTDGADTAKCYADGMLHAPPRWPVINTRREQFAGVHHLSPQGKSRSNGPLMVDGTDYLTIDSPPPANNARSPSVEADVASKPPPQGIKPIGWVTLIVMICTLFIAINGGMIPIGISRKAQTGSQPTSERNGGIRPENVIPSQPTDAEIKVRESEPAQELIFPQNEAVPVPKTVAFVEPGDEADTAAARADYVVTEGEEENVKDGEPKKKKATRGKRGGRKQKEKEADARAKKSGGSVPQATEIISVAASESPQVSGALQINSLVIQTDRVIGQGSCGTIVFEGSFEGRDVAVKRMLSQYYELASQEVSFLQQSDDHPNVVRYFCQQRDDHFLYIAVELCQASLYEVWEADKAKTEERQRQLRALKLIIQQDMTRSLQQLTAGLCHLHKLRIIHRDIKPQNILVAFPKKTSPSDTRLVISDFGLGKNLPENVSTLVDPTGNAGTTGWKAPELISQPRDANEGRNSQSSSHHGGAGSDSGATGGPSGVKRAADIFSLGCLFFWVLTDGIHPFEDENGWQQMRELNIKRDRKSMEPLARWSDAYEPIQLISSMLSYQPEHRPTAQDVLNHPFFWLPEKRLAFLCDVSDHFEREPRGIFEDGYVGDSPHLVVLESHALEVIGQAHTPHHPHHHHSSSASSIATSTIFAASGAPSSAHSADFLTKLDRSFVDTLGKQRKYAGTRLLDLLRALRNKKNHYEDMPDDVKKRVGPLPDGYLSYWGLRFPRLLMACRDVVRECRLEGTPRFRGYFAEGN